MSGDSSHHDLLISILETQGKVLESQGELKGRVDSVISRLDTGAQKFERFDSRIRLMERLFGVVTIIGGGLVMGVWEWVKAKVSI
ncbi:MAG: hypothetical protein HQL52_20085 [Magnetococcales bacterium]|nr:hypothetical protein [Magnetococcales bacterium]